MVMTDPLADMLTRIRNGQRSQLAVITSPASRLRENVLEVLKREGYIRGFSKADAELGQATLNIELKYHEGEPVIRHIARVSKPGRRVYAKMRDLKPFQGGLGISVLSTPRGVMSDQEARAQNLGGEVLCQVF
jgi:small subunit ribosomal protein S8